jgi:hypothetical protein
LLSIKRGNKNFNRVECLQSKRAIAPCPAWGSAKKALQTFFGQKEVSQERRRCPIRVGNTAQEAVRTNAAMVICCGNGDSSFPGKNNIKK